MMPRRPRKTRKELKKSSSRHRKKPRRRNRGRKKGGTTRQWNKPNKKWKNKLKLSNVKRQKKMPNTPSSETSVT
jgi:hypothetical protein